MGHDPVQGWLQNVCFSYSFLCRGIAVDSQSQMATFELTSEATVRFTASLADFFLVRLPLRATLSTGHREERLDWDLACRRIL